MATEGERIAALERALADLAHTLAEHVRHAEKRSDRVRELEAATRALVATMNQARRDEQRQYQKLTVAVSVLAVVVAVAAVIVPLVLASHAH